jgi:hypothetical protein
LYVGKNQISNIANKPTYLKNDNTSESWRKITKTPNNYTATNPLFD